MQIIRVNISNPPQLPNCVATMGNFDGLHLGHQEIIKTVVAKARVKKLPAMLITFAQSAYDYFNPDSCQRISKLRDKLSELDELGVDVVCLLRFNKDLANMDATLFAKNVLAEKFNVQELVIGADCRFGKARAGDIELLKKTLPRVTVPQMLLQDGIKISSRDLRTACQNDDLEQVQKLRGKPLTISGHISYGDQRGRELGFATANIFLPRKLRLLHGVFVVRCHIPGLKQAVPGVANIGQRPTIADSAWLLEVHCLDLAMDLYAKVLRVEILHKLRSEMRFASLQDLQTQIATDVADARKYFVD